MLDISVRGKSLCMYGWLREVFLDEYKGATKDAWVLSKEKVEDIIVYIKYILSSF